MMVERLSARSPARRFFVEKLGALDLTFDFPQ
jgi:hypothetical protein